MKMSLNFFVVLLLLFCGSVYGGNHAQSECVPSIEHIEYEHHSNYVRVHPSGNMILLSSSNASSSDLLHLNRNRDGKVIVTPIQTVLDLEPAPAAPDWNIITSGVANDGDGVIPNSSMKYYDVQKMLLARGNPHSVQPLYQDRQMTDYYQSSAQLPANSNTEFTVRTLGVAKDDDTLQLRDVTFIRKNGEIRLSKVHPLRKNLCSNMLSSQQGVVENNFFQSPSLAPGGQFFSAVFQGRTRIYQISGGSCIERFSMQTECSKAIMSQNSLGEIPKIICSIQNPSIENGPTYDVVIYSPPRSEPQVLRVPGKDLSTPGFTQDGRIFVPTERGFDFIDPNQQEGSNGACILRSSIQTLDLPPQLRSAPSRKRRGVR